jgi:hypothetical protein
MGNNDWSRHSNGDDLDGFVWNENLDTAGGMAFAVELAGAFALASVSTAVFAAATLV